MTLKRKLHELKRSVRQDMSKYGSEWMETQPVFLGDYTHAVLTPTPGMFYARQYNGKVIEVFNAVNMPATFDLHVIVGRKKTQPGRWQIIEERRVYLTQASLNSVGNHASQHMHSGSDRVPIDVKQVVQYAIQVTDAENFIIGANGKVTPSATGHVKVASQFLDLSSYVITSGAKYVAIELDEDGILSVKDGNVFAALDVATNADFPTATTGKTILAFVAIYESQETLSDADIFVVTPIPVAAFVGMEFNDAEGDPEDLGTATPGTSDHPARRDHVHNASTGGGHVIEDEGTPLTNRSKLNFVGPGVTVTDDSGDDASVVTIPSSAIVPYFIGGRLTLVTGTPIMTTTQAGKTTIYWTPYHGQIVPIYDGTNMIPTDVGGELSQATTDNTKSPAAVASNANYDLFIWNDAGTYRCTRGPAWSTGEVRGTGAGTTELEVVKGIFVNKNAITNGPAAQRGTYVGTVRSNGSSQIDYIFAGAAAGGTAGVIGVWNMYNRVDVEMSVHDTTASWTFSSATAGPLNPGGTGSGLNNRISYVIGLAEDSIDLRMYCRSRTAAVNGAFLLYGIGVDSTTVRSTTGTVLTLSTAAVEGAPANFLGVQGQLGFHFAQMLQTGDGTNTSSMFGGSNQNGLIVKGRF